MANEINITARLSFAKGGVARLQRLLEDLDIDVSGTKYVSHVQAIGLSEEALDVGSLTTLGWCWMLNLDDTNFVSIRRATGESDFLKLLPGEPALFRFDGDCTAPFAIADTAAVELEYIIVEP